MAENLISILINKLGLINNTEEYWLAQDACVVREGVQTKKTFLNGHRPFKGGGVDPCPVGLVLFLLSNIT